MSALLRQQLLDAPWALWPMQETAGTTLRDVAGSGRHLTLTNGYTLNNANAPWGKSVRWNAPNTTSQAATTGLSTFPSTTNVTLEAWVNLAALLAGNATGTILGKRNYFANTVADFPIALYYGATTFSFHADSGNDFAFDAAVNYTFAGGDLGRWVHLVGTYQASTAVRLFMDSVEVATNTSGVPAGLASGGGDWRVAEASEFGGGVNADGVNGYMAYVAIYGSTLSSDRIKAHYQAGIRSGVSY